MAFGLDDTDGLGNLSDFDDEFGRPLVTHETQPFTIPHSQNSPTLSSPDTFFPIQTHQFTPGTSSHSNFPDLSNRTDGASNTHQFNKNGVIDYDVIDYASILSVSISQALKSQNEVFEDIMREQELLKISQRDNDVRQSQLRMQESIYINKKQKLDQEQEVLQIRKKEIDFLYTQLNERSIQLTQQIMMHNDIAHIRKTLDRLLYLQQNHLAKTDDQYRLNNGMKYGVDDSANNRLNNNSSDGLNGSLNNGMNGLNIMTNGLNSGCNELGDSVNNGNDDLYDSMNNILNNGLDSGLINMNSGLDGFDNGLGRGLDNSVVNNDKIKGNNNETKDINDKSSDITNGKDGKVNNINKTTKNNDNGMGSLNDGINHIIKYANNKNKKVDKSNGEDRDKNEVIHSKYCEAENHKSEIDNGNNETIEGNSVNMKKYNSDYFNTLLSEIPENILHGLHDNILKIMKMVSVSVSIERGVAKELMKCFIGDTILRTFDWTSGDSFILPFEFALICKSLAIEFWNKYVATPSEVDIFYEEYSMKICENWGNGK